MKLPSELRGTMLKNPNLTGLLATPYFYMVTTRDYNVVSHVQYCRMESYLENVVLNRKLPKDFNVRAALTEIAATHLREKNRNKLLRYAHSKHSEEFTKAMMLSRIPVDLLIDAAIHLGRHIQPQNDRELNLAIALMCDLRDPLIRKPFNDGKIQYLSPVTTIILSYIGDNEMLYSAVKQLFPMWVKTVGGGKVHEIIRGTIQININAA